MGKTTLLGELLRRLRPQQVVEVDGRQVASRLKSASSDIAWLDAKLNETPGVTLVIDHAECCLAATLGLLARVAGSPSKVVVASRCQLSFTFDHTLRLGALSKAASLELIQTEARTASDHRFRVSDEETDAMVELIDRLGGCPAALTIAGRQLASIGVRELLKMTDSQLLDLRTVHAGSNGLGMRDLTAASIRALDPLAADAFSRLGYMPADFDLSAAMSLLPEELASPQRREAVQTLLAQSLIEASVDGIDGPRLSLSGPARLAARERFESLSDTVQAEVRAQHAEHFISRAEAAAAAEKGRRFLLGPEQPEGRPSKIESVEREHLRATLRATLRDASEALPRAVLALAPYASRSSEWWPDWLPACRRATQVADESTARSCAELHLVHALSLFHIGELEPARVAARRGLATAEATGEPDLVADASRILGVILMDLGESKGALTQLRAGLQALPLTGNFADRPGLVTVNRNLTQGSTEWRTLVARARLMRALGRLLIDYPGPEADRMLSSARDHFVDLGLTADAAHSQHLLAYDRARRRVGLPNEDCARAVALAQQAGDQRLLAEALVHWGVVAYDDGDLELACHRLRDRSEHLCIAQR